MTPAAESNSPPPEHAADDEVSLIRLYILRAMYLVLVIGLGAMIVPELLSHQPASRGVIPSLLGAVWVLAFIGLRHPLAMLPLLMFEFIWKLIWMLAYGLPQYASGQQPPTFAEDSFNIAFGAVLLFVIPWGYAWRRFVKRPGARWS